MDYLHLKLNILHRDLKTDNIFLVQKSGEIIEVKIGDFGLSLNEVNLYGKSEFNVGALRYIVKKFNYKKNYKIMFLLGWLLEFKSIRWFVKYVNDLFTNDQAEN